MNLDPASAERNLHHTVAYHSADELLDDILGLPNDTCEHGLYPGEHDCLPTSTHSYPRIEGDTATIDWSSKVPF